MAPSMLLNTLLLPREAPPNVQDGAASRQQPNEFIVARTFDYEGEAACDGHMHTFIKCIQAAAAADGQGFAAIKVSVLPRPLVLSQVVAPASCWCISLYCCIHHAVCAAPLLFDLSDGRDMHLCQGQLLY